MHRENSSNKPDTKKSKLDKSQRNKILSGKSQSKNRVNGTSNTLKVFKYVIMSLILVVVLYPPFFRGLYFEEEIFPTEILVFLIFLLFWVYKLLKGEKRFLDTPLDYAALGFVAVYLISLLVAVSLRNAISEWLKYCMYFAVFIMLSELIDTYKSKITVLTVMLLSSAGMCIIGIDAGAGMNIVNAINAFFSNFRREDLLFGLFVGDRIYSSLQYPNALAAVLLAMIFVSTGITIASRNLWVKAATAACSSLYIITFVFTVSRGAYAIAPFMIALFIIFLPKGFRAKGIAYISGIFIPSLLIVSRMSGYLTASGERGAEAWLYILTSLAISAVIAVILSFALKGIETLSWKIYAGIGAGLAVIFTVALFIAFNSLLPLEINSPDVTRKGVALTPGSSYKLIYSVEAASASNPKAAYRIAVKSRDEKDILFEKAEYEKATLLTSFDGAVTSGKETREVSFTVPQKSLITVLNFSGASPDSKATIYDAKIVNSSTGKMEAIVPLKYKYIPTSIEGRLSDFYANKSGIERGIFYKDGIKTFQHRWLMGGGGGAWPVLYFLEQSYMYWTTQAHNYVLQIAIECGVLGLLVLFFLVLSVIAAYILGYKSFNSENYQHYILQAGLFTGILTIILHSSIDFDLSLSAVFLILWELLAVFNSSYKNGAIQYNSNWNSNKIRKFAESLKILFEKLRPVKLPASIGLICTIAVIFIPSTMYAAMSASNTANQALKDNDYNLALTSIKEAVSLDPSNADYKVSDNTRASYANLLRMNKNISKKDAVTADNEVTKAEGLGRYNVNTAVSIASYYIQTENFKKGLEYVDRATLLRPMRPEEWLQRIQGYMVVIINQFNKGDNAGALQNTDKVLGFINEIKEVNKRNMNPFILPAAAQEMVEKLKYTKDNINKQTQIDVDRVIFYSMFDIDLNEDGIPDQFNESKADEVALSSKGETLTTENKGQGKTNFIQSRELFLQPGKTYRIEVEILNKQGANPIPFVITGVSEKNEGLKPVNNVYTAEFATQGDFKQNNNVMRMGINGKYEISDVRILEK